MKGLRKHWVETMLLVALIIGVKLIFDGVVSYNIRKAEFSKSCADSGGFVFIPQGVKGLPVLECRSLGSMIGVDL